MLIKKGKRGTSSRLSLPFTAQADFVKPAFLSPKQTYQNTPLLTSLHSGFCRTQQPLALTYTNAGARVLPFSKAKHAQ